MLGCDPLNQTMRSKMQNRRQRLNQQINKEMRMRVGAENLFKAATNRKLKEQVALELSFVNSNLQLLKEELAEINSDVEAYQNDSYMRSVPLIPLGLKETKKLDVRVPFTDYILEHYSADGDKYENEIKEFTELRQSIRTPKRNEEGIELLLEYYNQLYFIENRFFPPDRNLGVYFHWYDALTGVPSIQKSAAFEKGSILFNIAALFTQMGAKQDRTMEEGVNKAIECFESAAGAFKYLGENFSHAPSMDMSGPVLAMLGGLMLAQVQECIFEKLVLDGVEETIESCVRVAKEASVVSDMYSKVHKMMMQQTVKDYIPYSWISMVLVKSQHFKARAHHYAAIAIVGPSMNQEKDYDLETLLRYFPSMYNSEKSEIEPPQNWEERMRLGKAHIRQALMLHEEALRVHDLSKQLRKIDTLKEVLKKFHSKSMHRYQSLDDEEDFFELPDAPVILSKTLQIAKPHVPDFTKVQVKDIFHNLGPLAIFNSRNQWTAPRIVEIVRGMGGYGFTVRGDSPVIVAQVDQGFAAAASGVKEGDFIIGVNDNDVKWSKHEEVVKSILASPHRIKLELVSPLDKDFLHPQDIRRKETKSAKGSSELSPSSSDQSQSPVNGSMTSDSSLERQQPPRKTHKDSQGLKGSNASKNSKAKETITSTDGGKGSTGKKKSKKPEKTGTEERKRKAVGNSPAGLY
ncbi:rhophilin-1-like isoform X2 [Lytechinus variegatus]|uniref:rhophilin-1-like isoform X2 n=1 Tax=Lytechinus variegatus TaxID=7654 RepID=UPI001BB1CF6D|nr:rhophilin-1-like isoform X2 [Lytechinus variegatus]